MAKGFEKVSTGAAQQQRTRVQPKGPELGERHETNAKARLNEERIVPEPGARRLAEERLQDNLEHTLVTPKQGLSRERNGLQPERTALRADAPGGPRLNRVEVPPEVIDRTLEQSLATVPEESCQALVDGIH